MNVQAAEAFGNVHGAVDAPKVEKPSLRTPALR